MVLRLPPDDEHTHDTRNVLREMLEAWKAGEIKARVSAEKMPRLGAYGVSIDAPRRRPLSLFRQHPPEPAQEHQETIPPDPRDIIVEREELLRWANDAGYALPPVKAEHSEAQTERHATVRADYLAAALACLWNSLPKEHQPSASKLAEDIAKNSELWATPGRKQLGFDRGSEAIRDALRQWKKPQ